MTNDCVEFHFNIRHFIITSHQDLGISHFKKRGGRRDTHDFIADARRYAQFSLGTGKLTRDQVVASDF